MAPKRPGFYAVQVGRTPGVYNTWDDTLAQVGKFAGAVHKKFPTYAEAYAFAFPGTAPPPPPTAMEAIRPASDELPRPAKRKRFEADGNSVFTKTGKKTRTVFCDGSCLGNGKRDVPPMAGIGVFWSDEVGTSLNLSERLPGPIQTNNRAEMFALARILETDPNPELPLTICTDSQYTIDVFSQWIPGWRAKNWRTSTGDPVANKDLIQYVLALIAERMPPNSSAPTANVSFLKVKAHVGIHGNERADTFAKAGAVLNEVPERDYVAATKAIEDRLGDKKKRLQDLAFEVDPGDLWTDEELRKMETSQYFP